MIYETGKWLSKNDPKLPKLKVNANWILITRSGTTGIISSVPEVWEGFAISEHVIRVIPNESLLPSGYLMSYLKTQHCQNELKKSIFGSVIDEISIETILDLDIPLLELPIMKKIDSISKDALLERSQSIQKLKESKNIFDSILINNSLTKQAA